MSDEPVDPELQDGEETDPGEPIAALADYEHPASNGLLVRIRRKIQRRTAAVQLTSFATGALSAVFREFFLLLMETFKPQPARKDQ